MFANQQDKQFPCHSFCTSVFVKRPVTLPFFCKINSKIFAGMKIKTFILKVKCLICVGHPWYHNARYCKNWGIWEKLHA